MQERIYERKNAPENDNQEAQMKEFFKQINIERFSRETLAR